MAKKMENKVKLRKEWGENTNISIAAKLRPDPLGDELHTKKYLFTSRKFVVTILLFYLI